MKNMFRTKAVLCITLFIVSSIFSVVSYSLSLVDEMIVTLHTNDGDKIDIGKVLFVPDNEGYRYTFLLDEEKFENQFLMMRPFKCMSTEKIMLCHLAYLYPNKNFITGDDMADLEYDLLFLHKKPGEYGIDPWNGLYYSMKVKDMGLEGSLQEVDLNVLAAPPEEGDFRPITSDMLHPADPVLHWFPRLTIHQ